MLKLLTAIAAVAMLTVAGLAYSGSPCCGAGSSCCYPGSPCCYPGSPCCDGNGLAVEKTSCCPDGPCCPDGACCSGGK